MQNESIIQTFNFNATGEGNAFPPRWPFGAKYILCENENGLFFIADSMFKKHKDVQEKYNNYISKIYKAKVVGGGNMYYYGSEVGFVLTDSSVEYGKADHVKTKELLEKMFSDIPIKIE